MCSDRNIPAKEKIDCIKAITQTQLNICAQQQFTAADEKLNAVYKQVLAKLSQKSKQALIKAQREWVQFRDDNALAFAGQYEGGSMQPMVSLDAKTVSTWSRTNELQKLLKDQLLKFIKQKNKTGRMAPYNINTPHSSENDGILIK